MAEQLKEILAAKRQHYAKLSRGTSKRFIKRSELTQMEQDESEKSAIKQEHSEDLKEETKPIDEKPEETHLIASISPKEVTRKLRDLNQPIKLFGETEYDSFYRLRKLELAEPDFNDSYQNDFRDAMSKIDEDYLNQKIATDGRKGTGKSKPGDPSGKPTIEYFLRMKETLPARRGEPLDSVHFKLVADYFHFILRCWTEHLNHRPDGEKSSAEGKKLSAIHRQTIDYLRPLFKMLSNETLNMDILEGLVSVVRYLIERNYIKANDVYLEIAIGNAPWPIGVTMVGIHARPGREKVSSKYVAHVLNDETQRKFLQAVKRLITQNQEFFPTFPHRSVNFIKK